jgi:hypothetical protein
MNEGTLSSLIVVAITFLTLFIFLIAIFISGFIMKFMIHYGLQPFVEEDDLFYFIANSSTSVHLTHMFLGSSLLGILGAFQVILSLIFSPFPRIGNRNPDRFAGLLFTLLIIYGLGKAFYAIYMNVKSYCRLFMQKAEMAILEVNE